MALYDFIAPGYDPILEPFFRPFRARAMGRLPVQKGSTVLDLACGTGQNFRILKKKVGREGKIIGVDVSAGMLRYARLRLNKYGMSNSRLVHFDAAGAEWSNLPAVDLVVSTYSLTSIRNWEAAFHNSWSCLKTGGTYLIHDIDGQRRNLHTRAVELATFSHFGDKVWQPLQSACLDFRMDYIEPSAHLFGGRLFVATGTKPLP